MEIQWTDTKTKYGTKDTKIFKTPLQIGVRVCLPKCSKTGMWMSATRSNYINVPNSNVTLVLD